MTGREPRRLRWLLWLSAIALFSERLWPRLWPAIALIGTFIAIALLDLLPRLPSVIHASVLVGFALALIAALIHAWPALRPVDRQSAIRRLDRDAVRDRDGLGHRPLAASGDRLLSGNGDALSEALWQRHQQRMAAAAAALKVRWPAPNMARHEPWGVRAFVVLLLVIAAAAGRHDGAARLMRAVTPGLGGHAVPVTVDLWITPPAYTRRPPVFLHAEGEGVRGGAPPAPVHVAIGSTLQGRVTGTRMTPHLRMGETPVAFTPLAGEPEAPASFRTEAVVETGDRLAVRTALHELAAWPMQVITDAPPTTDFLESPGAKGNGLLALAYHASDDYGIEAVIAILRPAAEGDTSELRLPLALTEPGAPAIIGHDLLDLAAHPWAGHPVRIQIEVRDATGQTGFSPEVRVVLPERTFSHPVAQALIAERSRLETAGETVRLQVADTLAIIASHPEAFAGDTVVSLGLAVAHARLQLDRTGAQVDSVRTLLWDLALRLEEGGVPAAERQLQAAREKLNAALNRNASPEELARLMDDLKNALDEYLNAVATELSRREQAGAPLPPTIGQMLRSEDLRSLVEQAMELTRTGSRDAAQALLNQLQQVLDGIRLGLQQGAANERLAQVTKTLSELRALRDQQQELLDRTFQRLRSQQAKRSGSRRDGNGEADLQRQRALQQELNRLAETLESQLGESPAGMRIAAEGMRAAVGGMAGNRLEQAVEGQGRTVDALSQALDQAGQAVAQQLGNGVGMIGLQPGGRDSDPFGRSPPNGGRGLAADSIKIPEQSETQRVQQLLQELRRRAGDRARSGEELRYIERLLRQF